MKDLPRKIPNLVLAEIYIICDDPFKQAFVHRTFALPEVLCLALTVAISDTSASRQIKIFI